MINNKKLNPVANELFIRGKKKLNIFIVFITQSYFKVPKEVWLNAKFLIMKILNKREIQQSPLNH